MKYLVFGAAGSIGQGLVRQLLSSGHQVIAAVREKHTATAKELREAGAQVDVIDDVTQPDQMSHYAKRFVGKLHGITYAVGHCPPQGFAEAIKHPLSQLPLEEYLREIGMHQIGPLVVFQQMAKCVIDGGCFVILSSGITRLKGKPFPSFLHAYHHASVIDAENWLVDGMRADPMVAERGLNIHRLAPAAVNTPFHDVEPRLPKMVPIATVVEEIVEALKSTEVVDKMILPA